MTRNGQTWCSSSLLVHLEGSKGAERGLSAAAFLTQRGVASRFMIITTIRCHSLAALLVRVPSLASLHVLVEAVLLPSKFWTH